MVKKYKNMTILQMFCSVETDATIECRRSLHTKWKSFRHCALTYGVNSDSYREWVNLVRESIARYRILKYLGDQIVLHLDAESRTKKVSIPY